MNDNVELWKPIEGYEDLYEVSNWGRVRSIDRYIPVKAGGKRLFKGKIKTAIKNSNNGYMQIMLVRSCVFKLFYVHRLVAAAFVDNPYQLKCVIHVNGNLADNRAANLKYVDRSWHKNKELNLI